MKNIVVVVVAEEENKTDGIWSIVIEQRVKSVFHYIIRSRHRVWI